MPHPHCSATSQQGVATAGQLAAELQAKPDNRCSAQARNGAPWTGARAHMNTAVHMNADAHAASPSRSAAQARERHAQLGHAHRALRAAQRRRAPPLRAPHVPRVLRRQLGRAARVRGRKALRQAQRWRPSAGLASNAGHPSRGRARTLRGAAGRRRRGGREPGGLVAQVRDGGQGRRVQRARGVGGGRQAARGRRVGDQARARGAERVERARRRVRPDQVALVR